MKAVEIAGDLLNDVGESNPDTSKPDLHPYPSFSISPHPVDLTTLFEENYKDLIDALAGSDHSWTGLTLKLCTGLETANKLVQSTNSNVISLSEKVGELEEVFKKGDSAVAAIRGVISSLSENQGGNPFGTRTLK
uniref:Uncharacterized protein n=1 Tax=Cannabis sativa TaxID=3483 RepID=A0A803NNJ2_CANSA